MKIVGVAFPGGYGTPKIYSFRTDLDLSVGDTVVCDTANGLTIGTVSDLEGNEPKATKWIVQRVDLDAHKKRLEKEKALNAIKKKMDERRKQLQDIQIYQLLAQTDPEMKTLLEQYNISENQL